MDWKSTSMTGAVNQLAAATWLMQQGYLVFHNAIWFGPIDLVALKLGDKPLYLDVKTVPSLDTPIRLSEAQEAAGVLALLVAPEGFEIRDTAAWIKPEDRYRERSIIREREARAVAAYRTRQAKAQLAYEDELEREHHDDRRYFGPDGIAVRSSRSRV